MSDADDPGRPIPRWRLYGRKLFWPIVCVVGFAFVIFVLNQSQEFSHCVHEGKQSKKYEHLNEGRGVFVDPIKINWTRGKLYFGCAGHFTDKNEGALVALATIALSIFTFTLWRSTNRLWLASLRHASHAERAIKVAEDTAERQLRAYITIEPGGIGQWETEKSPHGRIIARNVGQTPAYDVEVAVKTGIIDEFPSSDITDTASILTTGDMVIVPGGHRNMAFYPEGTISPEDFDAVFAGTKAVIVFGYVRYRDAFDEKRRTSFCHLYRGPTSVQSMSAFIAGAIARHKRRKPAPRAHGAHSPTRHLP